MPRDRESVFKDIKERPERHRHNFAGLQACCVVNGALDMMLVEAHSTFASVGENAGTRCDVSEGPCACGAWH